MNFEGASAVFVLFAAVLSAVFGFLQVRNSDAGNAIKSMSAAVVELSQRVSALESERAVLARRVDELEDELRLKEIEIERLSSIVEDLGGEEMLDG